MELKKIYTMSLHITSVNNWCDDKFPTWENLPLAIGFFPGIALRVLLVADYFLKVDFAHNGL